VIAVLSVAVLAALWFWLVDRLMTTTERPGPHVSDAGSAGSI
jgi:ABC-2 type transport system permease protein